MVAEALGIDEGSKVLLVVGEGKLEIIPLPDAVTLSLRGRKVARITLRELEEESRHEQEKYIEKAQNTS